MSARRLFAVAALALVGAAFFTRAAPSLGYDELFTIWLSSRPWSEIVPQANLDGFTPPLFYGLVKLFSLVGLRNEDLRVLPIFFAGLAVLSGLEACRRLFGPASLWMSLAVIPGSAYLFTFAHELRPYSALMACAFFVLGLLGGPVESRQYRLAALVALAATGFSYLGLSLVAVWAIESRRRLPWREIFVVLLAALLLCAPGVAKAIKMSRAAENAAIVWSSDLPSLSAVLFGLAPMPAGGWIEAVALLLLIASLWWSHRASSDPTLWFLSRTFLVLAAALVMVDRVLPIGFAPRYAVLPMGALLLMMVGVLSRMGHASRFAAMLLLGVNLVAIARYLTLEPAPRENWRRAMQALDGRLGAEGVLLAFPFHHAAVAAHAYAPALKVAGGYTSRDGVVFWYEPPAAFKGYAFTDLAVLREPVATFRRLAEKSDICLLSDEADRTKTLAVFQAFEEIGSTIAFDAGDPRFRIRCRSTG